MTFARSVAAVVVSVLALALTTTGCAEDIYHYQDPPVTFASRPDAGGTATSELTLQIGILREQFFVTIEEGDGLPIVQGPQGGDWVMPAAHLTGLTAPAEVAATLTADDGEELGRAQYIVDLALTPEGPMEVDSVPIPVAHGNNPTAPIDDLYGRNATLRMVFTDQAQHRVESVVTVLLLDG